MKLYQIGLKNLTRRKLRGSLITAGLALAVAIEVALTGMTKSLEVDFSRKLDEYGANILILPKTNELSLDYGGLPVTGVSFGSQKLIMPDVDKIKQIRNSENVSTISPQLLQAADVNGQKAIVSGIDFKSELRLKRWWKVSGPVPGQPDEVLVGSSAAKVFKAHPGQIISIDKSNFRVAGLLSETGSQDDKLVFLSLPVAQKLFGKGNDLSLIEVSALCYNCPIDEMVNQIQQKLPNADVSALRQQIESRMDVMHRLRHYSVILSTAVVLFAALMIFVNMMSSVSEREREIGIFRAVGFKAKHIIAVLVFESFVISLTAGIIGYFIGLSGAFLAEPLMGISSLNGFGIEMFFASLALAVLVGVSASIYPALRASTLEPTVALRAL